MFGEGAKGCSKPQTAVLVLYHRTQPAVLSRTRILHDCCPRVLYKLRCVETEQKYSCASCPLQRNERTNHIHRDHRAGMTAVFKFLDTTPYEVQYIIPMPFMYCETNIGIGD